MKSFRFNCQNMEQGYMVTKTITATNKSAATRQFNRDYDNLKVLHVEEIKI